MIIEEIRKYLRGNRHESAPREYIEYILMTELWKCPPTVFEIQDQNMIDLHINIYSEELRAKDKEQRRANQKTK